MKFKKIMLASIILLAILTIGAVSAGDDVVFNETLTVEQTQEASINASFDDNLNDFEDDVLSSSQDEALLGDEITEENLHPWVSGHEPVDADWNPWIANVHGDDVVDVGDVNLTIFDDGGDCIFTGLKSFPDDADEHNDVIWTLGELRDGGKFSEAGTYTISLKYINGNVEFDLGNDYIFRLTEVNYNICDNVYFRYPFDVIRVWDERFDIKVYVGGNPVDPAGDNPFRWTLNDLGIGSAGDYEITIKAYDEEVFIEEFSYTLNVYENVDIELYGADLGVTHGDLTNPVLYLVCSDEYKNKHFKLIINGEDFKEFDYDSPLNWTLSDLGIDRNEDYDIKLLNELGDEVDAVWLNVNGFISQDSFNPWVSHNEPVDADWDPEIVNVGCDVREGSINLTIRDEDEVIFSDVKDIGDNSVIWTLDELRENNILNDVKTYAISLKYVNGDDELDLGEYNFTLTNFNYDIYEGDIYIGYPFDVIKVWSHGVDVEVTVGGNPNPAEPNGDNPLRWTLDDLGIDSPGNYTITIKANKRGVEDEYSYNINVYDKVEGIIIFSDNVHKWDVDISGLYLICSDENIGKPLKISINNEKEIEFEINSTLMFWNLEELGITENGDYEIHLFDGDDEIEGTGFYVDGFAQINVEVWDSNESPLYTDTVGSVISIEVPEGISGMLDIIVNSTVKFHTIITSEHGDVDNFWGTYEWDLQSLGITQAGNYNITLKFAVDGEETIKEYELNVVDFDNSTFRAKIIATDEPFYLYLFTPTGETGTVFLTFKGWDDEEEKDVIVGNATFELNESYWNKWVMISDFMNYDANQVDIVINGVEVYADRYSYGSYNNFDVSEEEIRSPEDVVVWVYADTTVNKYNITITSADNTFFANVTDLGDFEWLNGNYKYSITREALDSFISSLNDKDKITIFYDVGGGRSIGPDVIPYDTFSIQKEDDFIRLYWYEDLRVNLISIHWAHDEDEEYEDDNIVIISVPDSLNIHETALVHFRYGEREITKSLSELYGKYNYGFLGMDYYVSWDDLDLENVSGNYVLNISVTADDEVIGFRNFFISFDDEEGWGFDDYDDSIGLRFYYGQIGDLEFGMDGNPDKIIDLSIPKYLNIIEGTIVISDESGEVIFEKLLSEFEENCTSFDDVQSNHYWISDNVTEFDYSIFKENVPFAVSFAYGNTTKVYARGVRVEDRLLRINTPETVAEFFKITVSDGILVNGTENAIIIECTDSANRQSVPIDMGRGYFVVYVNDKKVEDLGRLIRVENETELDVFRLEGGSEGVTKLIIYLSDLNITDNGFYNIRVAHHSDGGETSADAEIDLFNKNLTLTSNVKVDNVTSEVFTGFGMDPILLYLDTYYGDINETSGTITVLNSNGEQIFTSDIKALSKDENGRYFLKYSDFENKNFGDNITVMYADGNERNGNTTVGVTWKEINPDEFNPTVKSDVNDYYGEFIDLNIPDLLNQGQIIVTVMFKNNHGSSISNMSVDTDFDSKAVYRFNVADIKANYGNDFALALYDLGFYEDNGNYAVDVKFTADNVSVLNVTNSTINVEFLKDVIITINETSRYAHSQPFAAIRVFEPVMAYGELYIDGKFYDKKSFERGLITFTSSRDWTVGNHLAEVRVLNSEFGSILNSSSVAFEVLAHTEDVTVDAAGEFDANEHVIVEITVPKAGNVTVQIDKAAAEIRQVSEGSNKIDLGILPYGNHRVWIEYEEILDDGNVTFFNNYLSFFVNDDGRWLTFPEPLVLNDDDTIKIDFGSDAAGYVLIYIDGALVKNATLDDGHAEYVVNESLFSENEKYGRHTYRIYYSGDKTHEPINREGEFTVAYIFKDDLAYEYPYKESYDITVTLPADARGQVRVTLNNQPQTAQVKDGKATFTFDNIPLGEHDVFIEYLGGDYPESSYHAVLNVSHYGVIGEYSDSAYVSLLLPTNATGNLTVYNDDRKSILCSVPLVNGKARVDLSRVSVGIYDIRAYYEGDDYDVRDFEISFKVMPKVNITQNAIIDEDVVIFVDLDNATGFLLIVMDGLSPVLEELKEGIVNYTLKTENYSYGDHKVNFMYIGNSFNGDVFNEFNEATGRYVAIDYDMKILCQNLTSKTSSDGDEWLIMDCGNATGTLQVFIDGTLSQIVEIVNGLARINIAGLSDGDHNFTFVYSGDRKFGSTLLSILLSIKHKVPRIDAGNFNIDYSSNKAYSVVVYKKDGSVASGVAVSFLINNKAFGNAISNSKGVASIVISSAPGSYKITSKALGVSVTKQLTVKKILSLKKVTVKRSAKKLVIKATLKKVDGKYLKGKKVIFKFKGKKYTAKTNKKGVAKVTIKKNVLKKLKKGKKVTYQATYLKDTVKRTVKVKK